MRRELAYSFDIQAVYHCPVWLCNHVEDTKEKMIVHLINNHTDIDARQNKKEDGIWSGD